MLTRLRKLWLVTYSIELSLDSTKSFGFRASHRSAKVSIHDLKFAQLPNFDSTTVRVFSQLGKVLDSADVL